MSNYIMDLRKVVGHAPLLQAVIGAKKYSCKVKVTVKAKNKVGESKRPSVSPVPEVSKRPSVSPASEETEIPATATPEVTDEPGGIVTIVYDGTNSDEIKDIPGKVNVIVKDGGNIWIIYRIMWR